MVGSNTAFSLSSIGTAGVVSGTTVGTINSGSNSVTVNGTLYAASGTATLTATRTSGLSLTAGATSAFNVLAVQPTSQASGISFTAVNGTGMTIAWTPAVGTNSIVLVKSASAVNSDPVDGTAYTANTAFTSGSQIGTGNYVVYSGSGSSVSITGLTAGTDYYVAVYAYNGSAGFANFLTTDPATESQRSLSTGDYRSKVTGSWSTAATWERWSGNAWATTNVLPTSADGVITIRNGHTVTTSTNFTADQIIVETGAILTVASNTLTLGAGSGTDLEVNGTLNVNGTLGGNNNSTAVVYGTLKNTGTLNTTTDYTFASGSIYDHALNGGTVPTATWEDGSLCQITGSANSVTSGINTQTDNPSSGQRTGKRSLKDDMVALAKYPLGFDPGSEWNYHVSTNMLAYMIERISGKSFRDYVRENVLVPLGMYDTDWYYDADKLTRFVKV
ncbi:MAG: hypothetical protein EOP51_30870, partial [Sphingobacteriales bacterium]